MIQEVSDASSSSSSSSDSDSDDKETTKVPASVAKAKAAEVSKTIVPPVAQVPAEKPSAIAEKKPKKPKEKKQKPAASSTTITTIDAAPTSQANPAESSSVPDVTLPPAQPLPEVATATVQKEKNKNEAWYFRTVASQYANDLDKLRTAPDFKGKESVEVLRWAMRLGVEYLDV